MTTTYLLNTMKTLRKFIPTAYAWRNLTLSQIRWNGIMQWNLAWGGSDRRLPCGHESQMFTSVQGAKDYLEQYGYTIAL